MNVQLAYIYPIRLILACHFQNFKFLLVRTWLHAALNRDCLIQLKLLLLFGQGLLHFSFFIFLKGPSFCWFVFALLILIFGYRRRDIL